MCACVFPCLLLCYSAMRFVPEIKLIMMMMMMMIFQAVIRFTNVTSTDSGEKQCVAENVVGRGVGTWTLLVHCE